MKNIKFYSIITVASLLVFGLTACTQESATVADADQDSAGTKPTSAGTINTSPANPYLIADIDYPMIYFDSASTDHTPLPGWLGDSTIKESQIQWLPTPPLTVGHAQFKYKSGEEVLIFSRAHLVP